MEDKHLKARRLAEEALDKQAKGEIREAKRLVDEVNQIDPQGAAQAFEEAERKRRREQDNMGRA